MKLLSIMMFAALAATPIAAKKAAPPAGEFQSDAIEMPLSTKVRDYQDWRIEQNSVFVAAVTTNQAGSFFGLLCGKTCSFYINNGRDCEVGASYPGLISGAGGALAVTLRCLHIREEGQQIAAFLLDEDVSEVMQGGGELGVVVPLADGQFAVSRFSLTGAFDAVTDMLRMADKKVGPTDFTL